MLLPSPVFRQVRRCRAIRADAFERDDGPWDIEARLIAYKLRDVALAPVFDPTACRSMNPGSASRLIASLSSSTPSRRPSGGRAPFTARLLLPLIGPLSGVAPQRLPAPVSARLRRYRRLPAPPRSSRSLAVLPTVAVQAFAGDFRSPHALAQCGRRGRRALRRERAAFATRLLPGLAVRRRGGPFIHAGTAMCRGMASGCKRRPRPLRSTNSAMTKFNPTLRLKGITHEDSRVPG